MQTHNKRWGTSEERTRREEEEGEGMRVGGVGKGAIHVTFPNKH